MRVLALRSTYDYLLAVGPGRSGTTYLYRLLRDHYAVAFPEIKEAGYYRSPDRYRRARRRLPPGTLLGDVDNGAYLDPGLPEAVVRLRGEGQRVLLVVVLRDQVERAECMMRFAGSRGRQLRRGGVRALERDVAALDFQRLIREPEALLNGLAGWCGIPAWPEALPRGGVNAGVAARWTPAAALGAALAGGMRRLGLLTALQGLKDGRRVQDLFFRALSGGNRRLRRGDAGAGARGAAAGERPGMPGVGGAWPGASGPVDGGRSGACDGTIRHFDDHRFVSRSRTRRGGIGQLGGGAVKDRWRCRRRLCH